MTSSTDTEITLGTGKLLFLFFFLVGICSLFSRSVTRWAASRMELQPPAQHPRHRLPLP